MEILHSRTTVTSKTAACKAVSQMSSRVRRGKPRVTLRGPSNAPVPSVYKGIPVDFQRFSDGTLLELVRRPNGDTSLLSWADGCGEVTSHFTHEGQLYVPRALPKQFGTLALPRNVGPENSVVTLIADIESWILQFVDITGEDSYTLASFVLSTWFSDLLPTAPYLLIVGPTGSAKTTLLKMLACFCRRPILLGNVTATEMCSLPFALLPTLLLDETDLANEKLSSLLRAGHTPGIPTPGNHDANVDPFCPKVITSRHPLEDEALASRRMTVPMVPSTRNLLHLSTPWMEIITADMQDKLLSYRLRNYGKLEIPTLEELRISPRARDVARVATTAIGDNPDLQALVLSSIQRQDQQRHAEFLRSPECFCFQALLGWAHESVRHVTVGTIAKTAPIYAAAKGESFTLEPRAVGAKLKTFGFPSQDLGRFGYGYYLSNGLLDKLHAVGQRYRVLPPHTICPVCKMMQNSPHHSPSEN